MVKFLLLFTKGDRFEQLPPKEIEVGIEVGKDTIEMSDLDQSIKTTTNELAQEHKVDIKNLHLAAIFTLAGKMVWCNAHAI